MHRKRLEFEPESLGPLRARYSRAVDTLVDVESVNLGVVYDPGAFREHVFDTEDGLRLIISREDQGIEGKVLHLSVSLDERFPDEMTMMGYDNVVKMVEQRFRQISGDRRPFTICVTTPDQIIHWYILEDPKKGRDPRKIEFTL